MAWKKAKDPAIVEPAFHHPDRCMNCGHLANQHDSAVGCLVEGGTKYIESDDGNAMRACSCEQYVPAPLEKEKENV